MAPLDPQLCPLCGSPNECGIASGKGSCWCFSQPVPREVIEKIPAESRELACVCSTCASGHRDPARILEQLKAILRGRG